MKTSDYFFMVAAIIGWGGLMHVTGLSVGRSLVGVDMGGALVLLIVFVIFLWTAIVVKACGK